MESLYSVTLADLGLSVDQDSNFRDQPVCRACSGVRHTLGSTAVPAEPFPDVMFPMLFTLDSLLHYRDES